MSDKIKDHAISILIAVLAILFALIGETFHDIRSDIIEIHKSIALLEGEINACSYGTCTPQIGKKEGFER